MPRIARGLGEGIVYHVLNRGNAGQEIFHKEQDYRAFIDLMREAKGKFAIKLFAYCLMPTHFHMIVKQSVREALSKFMQWLMTSHVRRYHRHYGSSGHVWQGRFKSFLIEEDNHLITVLRYVEGNPVRAGLVQSAREWPWSSHRETIGEQSRCLVDEPPVKLPGEWGRFVDTSITKRKLSKLRCSVNRQAPFGTPLWQKQMAKRFRLQSTLRPRGRPCKGKRCEIKSSLSPF
jgi:putative transposase